MCYVLCVMGISINLVEHLNLLASCTSESSLTSESSRSFCPSRSWPSPWLSRSSSLHSEWSARSSCASARSEHMLLNLLLLLHTLMNGTAPCAAHGTPVSVTVIPPQSSSSMLYVCISTINYINNHPHNSLWTQHNRGRWERGDGTLCQFRT